MAEQPELLPILVDRDLPVPGAAALRESLFTLPTHRFVSGADMAALVAWLGSASGTLESRTARAVETPDEPRVHGASLSRDHDAAPDSDVTRRGLPR